MGFGVEEIEEILPHFDNPTFMKKALEKKSHEICAFIESEQSKLKKITALSITFEKERADMIYDVELKELEAVKVLFLRDRKFDA